MRLLSLILFALVATACNRPEQPSAIESFKLTPGKVERISGCHVALDGMSHRLGPDLLKIVNRPVASAPGFDEYSPALKALGGTWTPERLDEFLRDPQSVAPGTTMGFPGIADDRQRAALVQYLGTVKQTSRKQSYR